MDHVEAARDAVNRARNGITATDLARRVGDAGGQVQKWLSGSRDRCPLALRIRIVDELKMPLSPVLTPQEIRLVEMGARALRRERRNGVAA